MKKTDDTDPKFDGNPGNLEMFPVQLGAAPGPEKPKLPQAAIGYIHKPQVEGGFHTALLSMVVADLALPEPVFGGRIFDHLAAPYLNLARNSLVAHVLKSCGPEVEVLLMNDADHTWRVEQAYQLLALFHPELRPVVSGLYFSWNYEKAEARPVLIVENRTVWNYPGAALIEVDRCGMGFCAISIKWLREWQAAHGETWFDFTGTGKESNFALEDRAFCERVQSTGKKVYVHTGIKIGHDKTVNVNEDLYAALMLLKQAKKRPVKVPEAAAEPGNN